MNEEGWYTDPFRLHERRWFSDGSPTELVGDGGIEATDPPPKAPFIELPGPWDIPAPLPRSAIDNRAPLRVGASNGERATGETFAASGHHHRRGAP
jgi:hypothetical protein